MPSYTQYKRQVSAVTDGDPKIKTWITSKGHHIPIMEGQTKEEAVKGYFERKEKLNKTVEAMKKSREESSNQTEQPKEESKPAAKSSVDTVRDRLKTAIKARFGSGVKSYGFGFSGKFEETKEDNGDITISIRHLGDWEVSDDDRYDPDHEDEDFEDWDWEVPTEETRTKVKNIVESIKKETGRNVSVEFGEKNWTYFTIEGGKNAKL